MPALSFTDARNAIFREVRAGLTLPIVESVELEACDGRVLAEDVTTDRDYPPFDRAMRDGFAVRAADIPGRLRVMGEVRAGTSFAGVVREGEAVEIMTGAPVPDGADAIVMVEHCTRHEDGTMSTDQSLPAEANISRRGCEAAAGSVVLTRGTRIHYAAISWLATCGRKSAPVFAGPRVAILSTGDEIVAVTETPAANQIRNSNAWSLAAQVTRAGGIPVILPIARDTREHTRALLERGLNSDLLLITGGVSAGKYDIVETVLAELGAEFFFDRALIQPGQPTVFGRARGKCFFGLPGNPHATMVTFEIFARAALELLSGEAEPSLPLTLGRLTQPFSHKGGLTRFLPARVRGAEVTPVAWRGSADIPSLVRANAYLVADADKTDYAAGDLISILFQ